MKKKVLIVIDIIIVVWLALIIIDVIRLINSQDEAKPLITITAKSYENNSKSGNIYIGLGYYTHYYKSKNTAGYGREFNLFGLFQIWSEEAQ